MLFIKLTVLCIILAGCHTKPKEEVDVCEGVLPVTSSILLVDVPEFEVVTNQIPKSFIGRWEYDSNNYFEIRDNGTFTVATDVLVPVVYTEKEMDLVAYYTEPDPDDDDEHVSRVVGYSIIEFRLKPGYISAPSQALVSLHYEFYCCHGLEEGKFESDLECYEYRKVQVLDNTIEKICDKVYHEPASYSPSEVVEIPEYNVLTSQIKKEVIGRYNDEAGKKKTKQYIKISKDGTIVVSMYDMLEPKPEPLRRITEKDIDFVAVYDEKGNYYFELRMKLGAKRTFPTDIMNLSLNYSNIDEYVMNYGWHR